MRQLFQLTKQSSESGRSETVLATRKDLNFEASEAGKDYYVTIKDVVDRINERRNSIESSAADLFRRTVSKLCKNKPPSPTFEPTFRRKKRKAEDVAAPKSINPSKSPTKLDLSWKKAGGDIFPKKSSRVGNEYQATSIPQAGSLCNSGLLSSGIVYVKARFGNATLKAAFAKLSLTCTFFFCFA